MKACYLLTALIAPAIALAQSGAPVNSPNSGDTSRVGSASARATATVAVASRIAGTPPVLDGKTDDAAWRSAQVIDRFLEYDPNTGAETRFKTELRVIYDDKYMYVLGRMFDPAPDSIVALLSRRDVRTSSEQLKLVIDSYHDRRTAYQFIVNPAGVKRDFYVYNDVVEDGTWDAVWDVATRIDSLGWVAEFRIPFSQMRFGKMDDHTFGLMAVRDVARTGARISWPLYHRDRQGYVSQAGEISGIRGVSMPRRLEITPYAVTKNETLPSGSGYSHPQSYSAGADLKYGVSSNLTLDATINPDFGQVEADPSVLNLSAFEQFFEERRPFFLEGAGIFRFSTACSDIENGCTGLFYSRRIGRSPQLLSRYGDETSTQNTTILGAAKLAGRLGRGLSVGVLDAVTQRESGVGDKAIEPATNYFVGRMQQEFGEGQSGVGLMLTSVNRSLDEFSEPVLRKSAYTGGVDLRHRFFDKRFELAASVSASVVNGTSPAISNTQLDGVHRYQRPDDKLAYDPTRTSLTGNAQRLMVGKFGGGVTRFQTVYQRFSPGFEINDLGFQSRADEQMFRNWFALSLNIPRKAYRRAEFNFNSFQTWTTAGLPTNVNLNTNWHVQFPNFWWGHIGGDLSNFATTYSDREARGGPALRRSSDYSVWTGFELDNRKAYTPTLFGGTWGGDEGRSGGVFLNSGVDFRVSSRFSGSLSADYDHSRKDKQWRANFGAAGNDTTHYTFARLDQKTLGITSRLNFTATPNLSMQFYGQPFVTKGDYSNWREIANARAANYDDRFRPYAGGDPGGFTFKEFRSNTVVRWEYRPGSTIFLVWAQGRQIDDGRASDHSLSRDVGDLFKLHPNNTFLVKASYWFNP